MESLINHHLLKLPPNALHDIRKLYNLDKPGRMEQAVDILQTWLQKQDHILKKDFGREYLETTIITCKGSVEKAKKQIDGLCTVKTLLPHFFSTTNVKVELQEVLKLAWIVPLPTVTDDLHRVVMLKISNKNFTEQHFLDFYRYTMVITEYLKAHDYVNGFIFIDDFQDADIFDMMTNINMVQLQQYMSILIDGFGARIKGINIISQSKVVDVLLKMVKPFLNHKVRERLHVRKNVDELYNIIPRDILSVEYGGKERSIAELNADWIEALSTEKHVEYMKMMNKACTDENLRSSDKFNDEYMGMPGSFRNLSVD